MKRLLHRNVWATAFSVTTLVFAHALGAQSETSTTTTRGSTSSAAANNNSKKPAEEEQVEQLPEFTVLGSRVPRVDVETPAPVVRMTIDQIEEHGYNTLGDFMQSLPFNSGPSNSIYQTASFTRGASTINPRGLGSNRFLTLINGRRGAAYALANNNSQSVFDFNSIPAAAIDNIEFLKDGASAIYGADAVTGVLNINLKKNFSGMETDFFYGNTVGHDTGNFRAGVTLGGSDEKTSYIVMLDFRTANSNYLRDYDVTTTDYTQSLGTIKGLNQNSSSNFPANVTLTRAQVAAVNAALGPGTLTFPNVASNVTSWIFVPNGGTQQGTPSLANFSAAPASASNANSPDIPAANRYNFTETYQRYPSYDHLHGYTHISRKLSERVEAFGDVAFSQNRTYFAFTPVVINFSSEGLSLPANNPYNPFGIPLTSLGFRSNFGPVRKFDITSTNTAFAGGLKGDFGGGSTLGDLHWEVSGDYGYDHITSIARNAIRASVLQEALDGTTRDTALNPFGPSDNQAIVDGLFTTSNGTFQFETNAIDATVTGKVADLSRGNFLGELGMAAGLEHRGESLTANPDTSSYVGAGGGSPLSGSRNVTSEFVELTSPLVRNAGIVKNIEVQLAARHEHYSDFGDTTKPKFGAKVRFVDIGPADRPLLSVMLRGTYSESFHAPDLGRLYATQTVAFSQNAIQDPLRPQDPPARMRIVTGGNPNLLPETSKMSYGGFVLEFPRVKQLSVGVDYFDWRIDQVIVVPGTGFLLSATGRAQYPDAVVRDNSGGSPGPIQRIETLPQNNPLAFQKYRGFDFDVKYTLNDTPLGSFLCEAQATRIVEIGSDSGLGGGYFNSTGHYNNPRWRGTLAVSWRKGDWGAAATTDYIGSYFNDLNPPGWGENPYTIVNPSITYKGLWNSKITLGATNVFDHLPPENGRFVDGFDPNTYGAGALGRFLYMRVRHTF